jgi:adenylate cyclase
LGARAQQLLDAGVYLLIVISVVSASMAMLEKLPFISAIERFLEDWRITKLTPAEQQHPDIIFVTITDQTLAQFPYRSPIDRHFLSELLQDLQAKQVKGILLDVLIDQATEPEKDAELRETIRTLKVPLVVSYAQGEPLDDDQQAYLDDFVPVEIRGFANLLTDSQQDTVRWIFPGRTLPDGTYIPGAPVRLFEKLGGKPLPPDAPPLALAYRGWRDTETEPFAKRPALIVKTSPEAWFKDKIAVVGADLSLTDRHRSPYAAVYEGNRGIIPGAEFFCFTLAQLRDGRQAPEVGWQGVLALMIACAAAGVLVGRVSMPVVLRVGAALGVGSLIIVGGFAIFRYANLLFPVITPSIATGISLWLTDAYIGRQERDQKKFIQTAFSKYLSPELLNETLGDPSKLSLEAKRREMTFIFTDVAGFTTISEKMDAHTLSIVLNDYFNGMCKIIFEHRGTVDKFIGDAVFAIFNAPKETADHARMAVACALKLDQFAYSFFQKQTNLGRKFGVTRIGVHCGWASVGNFGSNERFEYTALGDAVNTAARLEGLNKYFGTRICVSAATLGSRFDLPHRPLGHIVLKGKTEAMEVMEPLTEARASSGYIQSYLEAYDLLAKSDPGAEAILRSLAEEDPNDGVVKLYLERIAQGYASNYIEMTDK